MNWLQLFENLSVYSIGIAAVTWLAKTFITNSFAKNLAHASLDLQRRNEQEMEQLRTELRLKSFEKEIRFKSIYERQAEILAETYLRLNEVHVCVASYVRELEGGDEPSKEEKRCAAGKSVKAFNSYFYARRIYFPTPTAQAVTAFADKLVTTANTFQRGEQRETYGISSQDPDNDHWTQCHTMMKIEVPPLREKLERAFQSLLGIEDNSNANASGSI